MILSPSQIEELLKTLDKYTATFLAHSVGTDILTGEQKRLLRMSGVSLKDITRTSYHTEMAFKFGVISDSLGVAAAKAMTFSQLKKYLETGKVFGMSPVEKEALRSLKYQTASEVNRMGEKVKGDLRQLLVQADKKRNTVKHHSIVTNAAKKAVENKKYVNEVVSEIGRTTQYWERDLGRIADFVLHTAFDEGRAAAAEREGGENQLIYKDVYPGACQSCISAYLTGGVGSQPKLFTVAELRANGTNVGRKQPDWKPVVGPHHPHCRCTINKTPGGMTLDLLKQEKWEWDGATFVRVKQDTPRRERAKAKVQIGNKTVQV